MRIKLDENLGTRGLATLRAAGADVATVADEDLCSASDVAVAEVCRIERRTLITLDTDFANPLRFPPSRFTGLVVLRLPEPLGFAAFDDAIHRFVALAQSRSPVGRLWIIDHHRIREFVEREEP